MCIRDRAADARLAKRRGGEDEDRRLLSDHVLEVIPMHARGRLAGIDPVSYTHLRAHETVLDIVCRLLLEKKKINKKKNKIKKKKRKIRVIHTKA